MKLVIITHKVLRVPKDERVLVINVGKEEISGAYRDDNGDNISSKNIQYSELTGIYWYWKNHNLSERVFVVHYRRFFELNPQIYFSLIDKSRSISNFVKRLLHPVYFKANLAYHYRLKYDLIKELNYLEKDTETNSLYLPYKVHFYNRRVKEFFARIIPYKVFNIIENIISQRYPELLPIFNESILASELYAGNMFGMNKSDFNQYCDFLFSLLFEIEQNLEQRNYKLPERTMGYIAELLSNCYFQELEKKRKRRLFRVVFFEGFVSDKIENKCN